LVVSKENLHQQERLRERLRGSQPDVLWQENLSAVSIVGAGINATHRNVLRGEVILQAAGVTSFGLATSSFRTTWLVPRADVARTVETLHREFVPSEQPTLA
jgi:aspartate kinase